jgi:hypothetical protein
MWLAFVYFLITLIVCGQAIFKASIFAGGVALLGYALCYLATATFVGSYKARQMKGSTSADLVMIGGIAAVLIAVGLGLTVWSGFRVGPFDVVIPGIYWAILGIIIATLTTKKEHAL